MRNSFRGSPLLNEKGEFAAWNLGADYCAEHEWGIKKLQALFGISGEETVFGIDRRRVRQVPTDAVLFVQGRVRATLVIGDEVQYARKWGTPEEVEKRLTELTDRFKPWRRYSDYKTKKYTVEPTTAWDDGSFVISVEGKDAVKQLKELHDALVNGDGAVWLGGGGVFENAGLVIGIVSRFDQKNLDLMYNTDKERYEVKQYVKKIGIEDRLTKAGKKWYALSPGDVLKSRVGNAGEIKTKYDVMFWLNPQEQSIYNHGWFTVEELEQWAENKGPVVKTREAAV